MSRETSKYQIILLAAILLVVGTASLLMRFEHSSVSQQENTAKILKQYIEEDIIVNDFLDGKTQNISYTDNTFQYIAGGTFEELFSQLENQDLGDEEIKEITLIEYIKKISLEFVKGTQYENKVKINEIPSEDSINIFILKSDPDKLMKHFNNCSYIGWMNSIVCNINFLENETRYIESFDKAYDFILLDQNSRRPIDAFSEGEEEMAELIRTTIISSFLTWVIGHEIGHALYHKEYVIKSGQGIHLDSDGYTKREEQADLFVVQALERNSKERGKPTQTATLFWVSLGEYFQHIYREEVSNSLGSRISDRAWNSNYLPLYLRLGVEKSYNENPYLLRVLNILVILTKNIPDLDETGFYEEGIKPNIYTIPSRFDITIKYILFFLVPVLAILSIITPMMNKFNLRKRGQIK